MPLTTKQRRETNRANARKSTGPKTEEGKANSRQNAMTHGMRSETLAMLNEDPVAVAARTERWNDYYKPESPGAQHLVNVCVASTFLHDRVNRSHETAISSQVRSADHDWLCAKVDALEEMKTLLTENPAAGLRLLSRTATGCSWLVQRWKFFRDIYEDRGHWTGDEIGQILQLMGLRSQLASDSPTLRRHADGFKLRFFNNMIGAADPTKVAAAYLTAEHCPDELWNSFDINNLPNNQVCKRWTLLYIHEQVQCLLQRGRTLDETMDTPDRAEAKDRALTLKNEKEARLFLRYNSEARTGFQRAFATLVKTLEWDKEQAENGEEFEEFDASPNEADLATEWDPYDRPDPLKAGGEPECNELPEGDLEESPNEADLDEGPITVEEILCGQTNVSTAQREAAERMVAYTNDLFARSAAHLSRQASAQ